MFIANDIESILVQIRYTKKCCFRINFASAEIMAGNARLDFSNQYPYTEREAKDAFARVAQQHKWT